MAASLRTHPLGPSRAPANWARVTSFVHIVRLRLCRVWLGIYVGDCFCLEPEDTIDSAINCTRAVCALLGLQLETAKEQGPADSVLLLGAAIQVGQSPITASLPEKKRNDYMAVLRGILAGNSLTPAAAAKVRGKLGFAQPLMFGKFGRAPLHEFLSRQYSKAVGHRFPFAEELRETAQRGGLAVACSAPKESRASTAPRRRLSTPLPKGQGALRLSYLKAPSRLCLNHT